MSENKVTFGLENCHYAPATILPDGTMTYEEPIPFPGAVDLTLDVNGDLIEFEADNIVYYTSADNKGYTGKLNMALIHDHFLVSCLGEELDTEDGVQTERSNALTKPFALMFQFEGDKNAVRHVMYHCSANRPSIGSATGKNPNTSELDFNATPRPIDKAVKTKTTGTTKPEIYDNWFSAVYEKAQKAPGV